MKNDYQTYKKIYDPSVHGDFHSQVYWESLPEQLRIAIIKAMRQRIRATSR